MVEGEHYGKFPDTVMIQIVMATKKYDQKIQSHVRPPLLSSRDVGSLDSLFLSILILLSLYPTLVENARHHQTLQHTQLSNFRILSWH